MEKETTTEKINSSSNDLVVNNDTVKIGTTREKISPCLSNPVSARLTQEAQNYYMPDHQDMLDNAKKEGMNVTEKVYNGYSKITIGADKSYLSEELEEYEQIAGQLKITREENDLITYKKSLTDNIQFEISLEKIKEVCRINCIKINPATMYYVLSRLITVETESFFDETVKEIGDKITSTFLINSQILKTDGQFLKILVHITDNIVDMVKIDTTKRDILNLGFDYNKGRNDYIKSRSIVNVPLNIETIDFDTNWKTHIVERRIRVSADINKNEIINDVVQSIERACKLEQLGIQIKRFLRTTYNGVISVAIPLYNSTNQIYTSSAIVLAYCSGLWNIVTIESSGMLQTNLLTYSLYNMPSWFTYSNTF